MVIDGREVDYFCGTSYYTLHGDSRVIDAACTATQDYGLGPATHMSSPPLEEVARRAAEFFGTEQATYIASGYLGDMVLVQALQDDYDVVFADEGSHYSVFDGIQTTGKRLILFRHLDVADLEDKLRTHIKSDQRPLVMSDGVFPVTGGIAPLPQYRAVLSDYDGAIICVDDSHAVGVIGKNGRGTFEYHGMKGDNYYFSGTLSKACGGLGGVIPGDHALAEKISHKTRVPAGASPPTTAAAAAASMGLKILMEHPEMREQLWENVAYVRKGLLGLGIDIDNTPVPIVSVQVPSVDLKRVWKSLSEQGLIVAYIPPRGYSDAPDVESLRIAIFSTHTQGQLSRLVDGLARHL
jgi:glycine C-acetyltransferase/8-amino-7-oxononanoate synthase